MHKVFCTGIILYFLASCTFSRGEVVNGSNAALNHTTPGFGKVNGCRLERVPTQMLLYNHVELFDKYFCPSQFVHIHLRPCMRISQRPPRHRIAAIRRKPILKRVRARFVGATDIFAGEPPPQPVALALADVVSMQGPGKLLTRRWFDRVLDARMADLERTQPETLEEMET